MAINIQEILHPSDSDSIKFAKINYNFDQILANGGGPVGPKGQKGNQGVVGQTGEQGIQGEKGTKGDSGETTSPWKSIAIDLNTQDGVDNLTILKPKPDTDLETPVIWLGDSSFVNSGQTLNDGDTTLRSTLNVSRHYDINNSAVNAEYMTFWHDANNKIKLDSEDQSGYVRFNLSPVTPLVGSAPDIRFQINIPTIHTETFRLDNMAATGVLASGMVRYNSGGQKFEGYIDGAWVEFCTAPCGSGGTDAISFSPADDLTLNADGTPFGDSISFAPVGDLTLNNDGTVASSTPTLPVITNFDAYAVTGSSTEIECYWDSISDSTDVTITWGTGGSFTNVGSYTVTNYGSDTYTITGLTASTAYSIRMTATNANGNDVEERTATTEAAATTQAPTGVTGSFDIQYADNEYDACNGGGNATLLQNQVLTISNNTNPSVSDWNNAAVAEGVSLMSSGGYFTIQDITDHEGNTLVMVDNVYEVDQNGTLGSQVQCSTVTTQAPATTQAPNDFDFTNGQMTNPSGSLITFSNGGLNTLGIITGGGSIAINFDSSTSVSQSDFSLPNFVNWANSNPLTYNGSSDDGTLNLTVNPNTGSNANARTGNVTYQGTAPMNNVSAVTIQQDGTVISGPSGPQSNY